MCSKKSVLIWSVVLSLPDIFLFSTKMYEYKDIFLTLFIFPITLLFSLITYKMREEVFRAWVRFATWWIPLQIVLTLLTPESSGGLFISLVDKQLVAILLSFLFVLISLVLIVWKWLSTRRTS